jgi:hypothetical protein
MACLVLVLGGCGADTPDATTDEPSSPDYPKPSSTGTAISPSERQQREKEDRLQELSEERDYRNAKRKLRVAVDQAEGTTGKVHAVLNLACRYTYTSETYEMSPDETSRSSMTPIDAKYFTLYSKEYEKQWYPVVAYPFSLRRAMHNKCPDSFATTSLSAG